MIRILMVLSLAAVLAGCNESNGSSTSSSNMDITATQTTPLTVEPSTSAASGTPEIASTPAASRVAAGPTLTGAPTTTVVSGSPYSFVPTASDASGQALTFSIANKPSWASFNTATGQLSGTPQAANVGTDASIEISVTDGHATAAIATFSIAVSETANGAVTLSWVPPTENTDGTPLTNLSGFKVYFGREQNNLNQTVQVANPGITTYVVDNLAPGAWYFSIRAVTSTNTESAFTGIGSTVVNN